MSRYHRLEFPKLDVLQSQKSKARIFLVDLLDIFFSDLVLGGGQKKNSENDQLTGHFQSFFF